MIERIKEAIQLAQRGKFREAEQIYQELMTIEPENGFLLSAYGLFYVNINQYDKATEYLRKACKILPTFGTLSALGAAEYEIRNYTASAEILEQAITLGKSPDIYNKLITSLYEIKNYSKAIEYSEKMNKDYPDDYRSVVNQVKALTQSGQLSAAEKLCVGYLSEHPDVASLWFSLGYLKELIYADDKQALRCYKAAYDLGSDVADYNIAISYQKLGEYSKAEKHYKKMITNYPNEIEPKVSYGMCLLKQRKFKEGYEYFYHRKSSAIDNLTKNNWKPYDKIEDNVVVICDQGFGDNIQFVRYLPFLPSKHITVACRDTLRDLFKKNYPDVNFLSYQEIDSDLQSIRITDLAFALGMDFNNIPFSDGYLQSEAANIQNSKLKVGLCWEAGSAAIRTMIQRTIHVKCFEPFFDLSDVQIYSLQCNDTFKGNEKYPQMINLTTDFKNFADTAKALKGLDVVVTVDTSVAHLAGALGVKTFLLLPYVSDWRWFDDTKTTPWYKSVEIFKQTDTISWEKPLTSIMEKLQTLAKRRN